MSFKVTRLGPPRIRRDTIIVGGVVFTADDLANPAVALAALTDVDLTGLADGDTLIWDATAGRWIPADTVSSTRAFAFFIGG